MPSQYDVFRIQDGAPVWFTTADTLHEAKQHVNRAGCECIVMNSVTGEKIVVRPGSDGLPE
jgi:hypothetical protein